MKYKWLWLTAYLVVGTCYLFSVSLLIHAVQARWFPNAPMISSMRLNSQDRILLTLAGIGAAIAFGKYLVSGEKITLRLLAGRLMIGAALSTAAATALMMVPDMSFVALVGLGSALGIGGQSLLEKLVKQYWINKADW